MTILEQQMKDVLITAVEGGINYWAYVESYYPDIGEVVIFEVDEDDGSFISQHNITVNLMIQALYYWWKYALSNLNPDIQWDDFDNFDASDADAFIQFCCFGEVRYG